MNLNAAAQKLVDYLNNLCYSGERFVLCVDANNGFSINVDDFKFHEYHRLDNGILELWSISNNNNLSINLNDVERFEPYENNDGFAIHCGSYSVYLDNIEAV